MTNTPRMALVPVDATEEMRNDMTTVSIPAFKWKAAIDASPAGGKVSREQLRLVDETVYQYAMETTRTTTALVRAVIEALGLEIEK